MIDCPSCKREIARVFGEWLWKVTNCPFCFAPLSPVEDELSEGIEFYFVTEDAWQ